MLSIIITCKDHFNITRDLLLSIPKNTYNDYEIILVDDGSTDTTKYLKQDELGIDKIVRHTTNLGMPKSINDGLAIAEGTYVAIFNNDMLVGKNWDLPLIEALTTYPDIGMVSSYCYSNKEQFLANENQPDNNKNIVVWDMALPYFLAKETQDLIGEWDERFFPSWYDDIDIRVRLVLAGYKFATVFESKCYHINNVTVCDGSMPTHFRQESTEKFGKKWKLPPGQLYVWIDYDKLYREKVITILTPEEHSRKAVTLCPKQN